MNSCLSVLCYVMIAARICGRIEIELRNWIYSKANMPTIFWLQIKWNVVVATVVTMDFKTKCVNNGGRV